MRYFFALLLILVGLIGLGINLDWWGPTVWAKLTLFWPLILVFGGFDLVLRDKKVRRFLMVGLFFVSLLFVLLSFGNKFYLDKTKLNSGDDCCKTNSAVFDESIPEGVKEIHYLINVGATDLEISEATDKLLKGNFESNFAKSQIKVEKENEIAEVGLKTFTKKKLFYFHYLNQQFRNRLSLALNKNLSVWLDIVSGASNLNLDLSQIKIEKLDLSGGASNAKIKLGDSLMDNAKINISSGASAVSFEIPREYGVKLFLESKLINTDLDDFERQEENLYVSDNFERSQKKITIYLKSGLANLTISRY